MSPHGGYFQTLRIRYQCGQAMNPGSFTYSLWFPRALSCYYCMMLNPEYLVLYILRIELEMDGANSASFEA